MTSALVEGATSEVLCDTDWALNMELCDIVNNDPPLAKDVLKAVKRRIRHKSPNVQELALVLLETLVKNCGDKVRSQIIERGVLQEMVKVAKKKANAEVREKIVAVLDSWKEFFEGSGKFLQYQDACHDLIRSGIRLSDNSNSRSVGTTEAQETRSMQSQLSASPDHVVEGVEVPHSSNFPEMSLLDIQKAQDTLEVFTEMLDALNPKDKESVKDEVIMDLVEQCSFNKQRAMKLVTTTSDEDLLFRALALNDDLQRALNKHDQIASGSYFPHETIASMETSVASSSSIRQATVNNAQEEDESEDDTGKLVRRTAKIQATHENTANGSDSQSAVSIPVPNPDGAGKAIMSQWVDQKIDKTHKEIPRASSNHGSDHCDSSYSSSSRASSENLDQNNYLSSFQQVSSEDYKSEEPLQSTSTKNGKNTFNLQEERNLHVNGAKQFKEAQIQESYVEVKDRLPESVSSSYKQDTQNGLKSQATANGIKGNGVPHPSQSNGGSFKIHDQNFSSEAKMVLPAIPPPPAKYQERQKFFQRQQALASQNSDESSGAYLTHETGSGYHEPEPI